VLRYQPVGPQPAAVVASVADEIKDGQAGGDLTTRTTPAGHWLAPGAVVFVVIGSAMPHRSASPFTQQERDLIRLELMPRFGQAPDLANSLDTGDPTAASTDFT